VGGGGDKQVHGSCPRLPPGLDDGSRDLAVAGGDRLVDRQGVKPALQQAEPAQPLGARIGVAGDEDAVVQFGNCDGAKGARGN
jgi:hypothetical protein